MSELNSNLFIVLLSILSIVVSLVSMIVSIAQATITQSIAQKALSIEAFRHKIDSFNYIKIACSIWQRSDDGENTVHIDIFNNDFGVIKIESIEVAGFLDAPPNINGGHLKFPLELRMNVSITLQCEPDALFRNSGVSDLERIIKSTRFTFRYFTEAGARYQQSFSYSSEHNKHIGQPKELFHLV